MTMTDPSREAFEKWAISEFISVNRSLNGTDGYFEGDSQIAWDAWQARTALATTPDADQADCLKNFRAILNAEINRAIDPSGDIARQEAAIDTTDHLLAEFSKLFPEEKMSIPDWMIDTPSASADDLAALVTRLARSLRKAAPDNDLPGKAMDYLAKHGIAPSPLREVQPSQTEVQAEPVAWLICRSAFRVSPDGQDAEGHEWLEEADEPGMEGSFPVYTAPQAQPADALDAETIKKAARYDWLRSGNDYQSDGPMVVLYESEGDRGDRPYWSIASDALDASIDAAMAAAQEGGKA